MMIRKIKNQLIASFPYFYLGLARFKNELIPRLFFLFFMSDYEALLESNYELVSKGWGYLKEGEFNTVPEGYRFMDCKWKAI